ncbi:MAG: ABC transporter substrate-binding protein [Deltaproteobacteria bacterium]|nr:ABC transporter substrate-binding protein [Deltaproteobacteria bacterium]
MFKQRINTLVICSIALAAMLIFTVGCKDPASPFTIGIVANAPMDVPVLQGVRSGMEELGYIEGKNIRYIYKNVPVDDEPAIDAAIKDLLSQGMDILLTLEGEVCLRAKATFEGSDLPILFSASPAPVESGLVKTLSHPGGNLTGVMLANTIMKALEWSAKITPDVKKIYLPYNPDDNISAVSINDLAKEAPRLGIELVIDEVHSVEETIEAIKGLPEDIDNIFLIPSKTLNPESSGISLAALNLGIPTSAALMLDESVLLTLTADFTDAGKKTARLAHLIFSGTKPEEIPVETSEAQLIVNLRIAEKLNIKVSNDILAQATAIIR